MKYKILVADSNWISLFFIKNYIESSGDFEVIETTDGKSACYIAESQQPDLVIIDWNLNIMNGFDALKNLKAFEKTKDIPVIVFSSVSTTEIIQDAFNYGATDFIRRPIDKIELIARINSTLQLYKTFREINEQKRKIQSKTEELIKKNKELSDLSLVASKTDNSVMIINENGEIEWVNEGFTAMYEFSLDEFREKYGKTIYQFSENLKITNALNQCLNTLQSTIYQFTLHTKSGKKKSVQTTLTPIIGLYGHIEKLIAVESDISVLKEIEEELLEKQDHLLSIMEHIKSVNIQLEAQKKEMERQKKEIEQEKKKSDDLLHNILPFEIAHELKVKTSVTAKSYKKVSVMFTDFKAFTKICENLPIDQIVQELNSHFVMFDDIIEKYYIEKIKTIGDAYMCAAGIPMRNKRNPFDVVLASLDMLRYLEEYNAIKIANNQQTWEIRIGIHTGAVFTGVVGRKKFAYDLWGDTVNIASRMESSGEVGKINITDATYQSIKDYFDCEYRGKISAKNMGEFDMYFVNRLKPEFSQDDRGYIPNDIFLKELSKL